MSEKYISVDNLLQWIGERITCEALCSNPMKSDKGCDGNCILGEITPREKSIISVITESIKNAPAADVEPVVRGWWVPNKRYDGCMVCDQCGFGIEINTIVLMECNRRSDEREFSICAGDAELAYCPNCGAHMERSGSGE